MDIERLADLPNAEAIELVLHASAGSYTHTLLEWSASSLAIFTGSLAFTHFWIKRDPITAVIGIALFCAGMVDAFHTLAADRLIEATADNHDLIPFTWAISRTFNAVIPISALAVAHLARRYAPGSSTRYSFRLVIGTAALTGMLAYAVISWCATSHSLPQTTFPDALISRPWDVYPLVIYVLSGLVLYPLLLRGVPTHFAQALWLSVLANASAQIYMALGSVELFDNAFNIAHFLKIVAYLIPCLGLIADEVLTHSDAARATRLADEQARRLSRSNAELTEFAVAAAHDLRSPLRAVHNLATWTREDAGDSLNEDASEHLDLMMKRIGRMEALLDGLLAYAEVGSGDRAAEPIDLRGLVTEIAETIDVPERFTVDAVGAFPTVVSPRAAVRQVLTNLIANALDHHDRDEGRVEVRVRDGEPGWVEIEVEDDGPGIPEPYAEKIFQMFQTLKRRDEHESSGLGLALVHKRVKGLGGEIEVSPAEPRGAIFRFTWPKTWEQHGS